MPLLPTMSNLSAGAAKVDSHGLLLNILIHLHTDLDRKPISSMWPTLKIQYVCISVRNTRCPLVGDGVWGRCAEQRGEVGGGIVLIPIFTQ